MTDTSLPADLADLPALLASLAGTVVLGYSGGLDSTVLLHALVRAGAAERLLAVHVHHGLSEQADAWSAHCRAQCQWLGVRCVEERVVLAAQDNLEARARQLRRDALMNHVGEHDELWLAQHRDDQAETLLLRLMRGAGSRGLAGMPALSRWQGRVLRRPLLALSRERLEQLAQHWALSWVEDDSNQQARFDRNFLRLEIMPLLRQRWPAVSGRLASASERLGEDAQLLDQLAQQDLQLCGVQSSRLDLVRFVALSPARQRNALRGWIGSVGMLAPSAVVLQRVLDEVLTAAPDREPQVEWPGGVFTRFRNQLYLLPLPALASPPAAQPWWPDPSAPLHFGHWTLRCHRQPEPGDLSLTATGPLQVRSAQGGERLLWRGMHRQVSELWRQAAIPPWQRRQLPLLYRGDQLVAAAAIGVADDCHPGAQQQAWHIALCMR